MIKKCLCILLPFVLLLPLGCGRENGVPPTQEAEYTYLFRETDAETTEAAGTQAEENDFPETTTAPETTVHTTTVATTAVPTTTVPTTVPATAAPVTTVPATTVPPTTRPPTTAPATTVPATTAAIPETTKKSPVCTVAIRCDTVLKNRDKLKQNKLSFIPSGGVILPQTEIPFTAGETAFDVLKRACETHVCADRCAYCENGGIQLEYTFAPGFATYYVEGIHQLYEKDCGSMSGWMYSVNGVYPNVGASSYTLSEDDAVVFSYTCDMGEDIGNHY